MKVNFNYLLSGNTSAGSIVLHTLTSKHPVSLSLFLVTMDTDSRPTGE